jgi:hypothetical protein
VGYCEVSKAFRIYIPGHHHIEISRDVTFDEDAVLKKSRRCQLQEVCEEEPIIPRTTMREVPRPKSKDVVSSKWLFKIKHAVDGSIEKYKARFVARGFS